MNVAPKRFTYRGCGFFAPKQQDATLSCFEGWDGDGYVMAVMAWLWLLGPLGPGPEGMWLRQLWQWTKIHRCANSAGTLQHTLIISSILV